MGISRVNSEQKALLEVRAEGTTLVLLLSGDWLLRLDRPIFDGVEAALNESSMSSLQLKGAQIAEWDTALLLFVRKCHDVATDRKLRFITSDLPEGVQQMVDLSLAVPEAEATPAVKQSNCIPVCTPTPAPNGK